MKKKNICNICHQPTPNLSKNCSRCRAARRSAEFYIEDQVRNFLLDHEEIYYPVALRSMANALYAKADELWTKSLR